MVTSNFKMPRRFVSRILRGEHWKFSGTDKVEESLHTSVIIILWYHGFSKSCRIQLKFGPQYCFPIEEWEIGEVARDRGISIYTDRPKIESRVGDGIFSAKLNTRIGFRLPDHCNVFQAEVRAIKKRLLVHNNNLIKSLWN